MNDLYAALDLGSNSFHLLLARRCGDGFETVERIKEKVRLLAGFRDGRLHPDAMERGRACLARFAQRLAAVPRENLKMAGTHALREASNRAEFVRTAEAILGVPLEVVSGEEEARLVYLGVAHHLPREPGRGRLVVDVGGGSTEFAWGNGHPGEPARVASLKVGCVSLTETEIAPQPNQALAFVAARRAAVMALDGLEPVEPDVEVLGTSGTVESVLGVLAANGWGTEQITREGLDMLTDAIVSGRWLVDAGLPGLHPERVDIFAAGLALVDAIFHVLKVDAMRFVDASLQDGLLYRHGGLSEPRTDLRDATIARLKERYRVDADQAARVRSTALELFDACARDGAGSGWPGGRRWRDLLGWAAELHELGLVVAPRHYHRHGAYLLQHSDMRAFSRTEQDQLVLLVRGHRRAFPGLSFRAYDRETQRCLTRLLALLRIAVIVHRGHSGEAAPELEVRTGRDGLTIAFPSGWLDAHPLSARELEIEVAQLARAGIGLRIVTNAAARGPRRPAAQSS
ncbi:MAG TPA: Ppx/GppA phosphatase family protein [Pseudomonadales bacterium]